jgi:hypothetical protein
MNNPDNTTRDELDVLRDEMSSLRQSLSTQKIVSEKLMRRVMAKDSAWMNKYVYFEILFLPFVILLYLGIKVYLGVSGLFVAFTAAMFVIDVIWDYHIVRMPASDFAGLPMLELRRKIVEQMNARKLQFMIELPLFFLWAAWFLYELSASDNFIIAQLGMVGWAVNLVFGLTGGVIAVSIIYRKFQKQARELLSQISNFENE